MEFWLGDCDLIPNSHVLLWTVGEAGIRYVFGPLYGTNMHPYWRLSSENALGFVSWAILDTNIRVSL
jgi:hypothetical protein